MTLPAFHPRLLTHLERWFEETCTIMENKGTYNELREKVGAWTELEGHTDLLCVIGVVMPNERMLANMTPISTTYDLLLKGYYPAINERMRVIVRETLYDIQSVRHDQTLNVTQLALSKTEAT